MAVTCSVTCWPEYEPAQQHIRTAPIRKEEVDTEEDLSEAIPSDRVVIISSSFLCILSVSAFIWVMFPKTVTPVSVCMFESLEQVGKIHK
jgi:hypothetical protein